MQRTKNIVIAGANKLPIVLDIFFKEDHLCKPVVIYAHGFSGFKDWGNFDLIASEFAGEGFVLVKFNFSHNGTTAQHPADFNNLEAFGNNNYSTELKDLRLVIDWVCDPLNQFSDVIDRNQICVIGHSMGGGIAILEAANDTRVNKLITWAAISECKTPWGNWSFEKIQEWKNTGVQYYTNGRTKQEMPMYYQLYEDFIQNAEKLNIQKAIRSLQIPILICHGTNDTSVPEEKAYDLKNWQPSAQLFTVDSDHVFGRKHPWISEQLPPAMNSVVQASIQFLKSATR